MRQKTLLIIFFIATYAGLFPLTVIGSQQQGTAVEYKIKAAFLLNFAKFISWPTDSFAKDNHLFNICVLGKNPFGSALSAIKSRSIGNKKINLSHINNAQKARNCRLIFISHSEKNNLETVLATLSDRAIATVSDINGFARSGGIIEFITRENKLAFIINLRQAHKQGLEINSSLLNLATEVIQ